MLEKRNNAERDFGGKMGTVKYLKKQGRPKKIYWAKKGKPIVIGEVWEERRRRGSEKKGGDTKCAATTFRGVQK